MNSNAKRVNREIEKTNIELLRLLNYHASLIKELTELKEQVDIEYFETENEKEMLNYIIKNNFGPLNNDTVKEIFKTIFSSTLNDIGIKRDKSLLISSESQGFLTIQEIFKTPPAEPVIIAGPCAVENSRYLECVAQALKRNGIKYLRGGAFKPRTSPYEFQGLKRKGLALLKEIGEKYNLVTVTEVVDTRDIDMVAEYVDILQVGARNMHNFELLKEVGLINKPILLKRGMSATIQELMYAAEYVGLQGNRKIILCERGIRTFETKTRNTLDIASIPIIKKETCLPILVDLSHSLGRKDIIGPIAKAALAAGADGIMIEVHPYPELALSDSKQQLNIGEFENLLSFIKQ